MFAKFVKEEGIQEVAIMNVVIMFYYTQDIMVFFSNTLEDAQKVTRALDEFHWYTKFNVNDFKTNIMLVKSQIKDKPCIMYNNEPLNVWKAKYTFALKLLRIIDRMNVLHITYRREREHIIHLRTYAIMKKLSVESSINIF